MPPHDRLAREADHYSLIGIQLDIARIVQEIIRCLEKRGEVRSVIGANPQRLVEAIEVNPFKDSKVH